MRQTVEWRTSLSGRGNLHGVLLILREGVIAHHPFKESIARGCVSSHYHLLPNELANCLFVLGKNVHLKDLHDHAHVVIQTSSMWVERI